VLHLEHSFYGAGTWTLRKKDQKVSWKFWIVVLENNCFDRMKNEEELRKVEEEGNILHKIKRKTVL
jgi:hypothetical protein